MTIFIQWHIAIGVLLVAVFNTPIRDKVEDAYLFGCVFGSPKGLSLHLIAFAALLVVCCAVLWPLYLRVVWGEWKAKQPMTDEQLDAWNAEWKRYTEQRALKNITQQQGNRGTPPPL